MNDLKGMNSSGDKPSNQSITCESLETSDHPILQLVYSLPFVVGLILNSFTLWFYCRGAHGKVYKSWMIYMKNLTAADLLLCMNLPLRIVHYTQRSFTIQLLYCGVGAPLLFLNMAASILFMGYIAANRYMKVCYSSGCQFLLTDKASYIISVTTWVVLLAIATPYPILMLSNHIPHNFNYGTCDDLFSELLRPLYLVVHAFASIIFLLVLFALIFFYSSTSSRVFQIQRKQLCSSNKKLVKSRRNILLFVSVFCICFVPYHLFRLPYILIQGKCSVVLYYLKEALVLLSVFNICLDPLIYVFLCKEFRAQINLKHIFCTESYRNTSSSDTGDKNVQLNTNNTSGELLAQ